MGLWPEFRGLLLHPASYSLHPAPGGRVEAGQRGRRGANERSSARSAPVDEHDRVLLSHVHPLAWVNPVAGGGTTWLVIGMGT